MTQRWLNFDQFISYQSHHMHDLETSLNLLLNSSKICHFSSNHSSNYIAGIFQPDAVLNRDVMCRHTRGITLFKAVILSVWDHGYPKLHVFIIFYRRFLQWSPSDWTQNCNSRQLQHLECYVSVGSKKTIYRRNGNL